MSYRRWENIARKKSINFQCSLQGTASFRDQSRAAEHLPFVEASADGHRALSLVIQQLREFCLAGILERAL